MSMFRWAVTGLALAGLSTAAAAAEAVKPAAAPIKATPAAVSPAPAPAAAATPESARAAALAAVSSYFNSVRSMSGSFVQLAKDGGRSSGLFAMVRPGKIRFQYAKPSSLDVVADGVDVVVKDRKNQTQDLYPLKSTPLRYLLADRLDLTTEPSVSKVTIKPEGISVALEQSTMFGDGRLIMLFDRKATALKQWTVIDAQGNETTVVVSDIVANQPVDPDVFFIDRMRVIENKK